MFLNQKKKVNFWVKKTVLIDSRGPAVLLMNSLEEQRSGVINAEERLKELGEAQNPQQ